MTTKAREITRCRSCGSDQLESVLSLGDQYLSEFVADPSYRPPRHPLDLVACQACTLSQLRHTAPSAQMFHGSYSFKSGISDAIRRDLASVVVYATELYPGVHGIGSWLDIASNDGTLLSNVPPHIRRVGIDPLKQFADEARQHANSIITDFFSVESIRAAGKSDDLFDVITSVSMFYDLDDPNEFVADVAKVLHPRGIWVIQQNYLPTMIANCSFDNISHEHLTYFSMTSLFSLLERHGLKIVDADTSSINGGCFRTAVVHADFDVQTSPSVADLITTEQVDYSLFTKRTIKRVQEIGLLVRSLATRGNTIYIYGASTRGGVIWQAAGIDSEHVSAVVERNPDKFGKYMSAIGVPIISEEDMRANPPDYLLLGPYWLVDDVVEREREYLEQGGSLIVPLPNLEIRNR